MELPARLTPLNRQATRRPLARLPEDFLIASTPSGTDLSGLVNRRIAVTGTVSDAKDGTAPPGANTAEKALKRLNAQSIKEVASNCASATRSERRAARSGVKSTGGPEWKAIEVE